MRVGPFLDKNPPRSHRSLVPSLAGWAGAILLMGAAGCSSGAPRAQTHPGRPRPAVPSTSVSSSTTTSAPTPTSTTAPAVTASSIQVQISGPTVVVQFASADLTGSLRTADPGFSSGGTVFSFMVEGVSYAGAPVNASSPTSSDLVSQAVASAASGGVVVRVTLRSPATAYQLGLGHDEVGLTLSAN